MDFFSGEFFAWFVGRVATAVVGDDRYDLVAEDTTWVPSGVPHCFINRGGGRCGSTGCTVGET
jgi:mannose-6-phosphate isomerase-like protein (cupin superfamily)